MNLKNVRLSESSQTPKTTFYLYEQPRTGKSAESKSTVRVTQGRAGEEGLMRGWFTGRGGGPLKLDSEDTKTRNCPL